MISGWARFRQGKVREASGLLLGALDLARKADDRLLPADFVLIAAVCRAAEEPVSALRLLAAHASIRSNLGIVLEPPDQSAVEEALSDIRTKLEPAAWDKAWGEGAAMSLEEAAAAAESLLRP